MDINSVYGLSNVNYLETLLAVDNQFIRQLASLSVNSAKNLKMVSYVLKDKVNNRGEIAKRGVHSADKSIVDIAKLTPLVGCYGVKSLPEEVACYRANMLRLENIDADFLKRNTPILMIDYLLSACVCYVEVFDSTVKVDKFFATRNRFIAGKLGQLSDAETSKYVSYLTQYASNYDLGQLRVLKLRVSKNGFKVSQPRGHVDFTKNVKVTPLFFITTFLEGIEGVLANNIVKFKYVKDNFVEREFITTTSTRILSSYYDTDFVQKMIDNSGKQLNRGYVKLPELGISKYDETGTRSLNISRITSIELLNEFDARFIDVDFNTILPCFKETINNIKDVRVLNFIHFDLVGSNAPSNNIAEIRNSIIAFIDSQYAIGTTTALRQLHLYMINHENVFNTYNGGKPRQFSGFMPDFNLGVE